VEVVNEAGPGTSMPGTSSEKYLVAMGQLVA